MVTGKTLCQMNSCRNLIFFLFCKTVRLSSWYQNNGDDKCVILQLKHKLWTPVWIASLKVEENFYYYPVIHCSEYHIVSSESNQCNHARGYASIMKNSGGVSDQFLKQTAYLDCSPFWQQTSLEPKVTEKTAETCVNAMMKVFAVFYNSVCEKSLHLYSTCKIQIVNKNQLSNLHRKHWDCVQNFSSQ